MPQELDLNISPYFDDFKRDNNYHKVLFKPGYPVQARELTTLQSMLQSQIEEFGNHFFKEGSLVTGGGATYIQDLPCVLLQASYLGTPIDSYMYSLLNKTIRGAKSGIRAVVMGILPEDDSTRNINTLYISFLSSDSRSSSFTGFAPNEAIIVEELVDTSDTTDDSTAENEDDGIDPDLENPIVFQPGSRVALTVEGNPNGIGSGVKIEDGVYYLRGHFVSVDSEFLLLDQYTNQPSYKIGFEISEEIVTYNDDDNLVDNAQGFTNFSAPGADRFSITAELIKLPLNSTNLEKFVQIMEVRNGVLITQNRDTEYTKIADELARRTYDQSGDFYVKAPSLFVRHSLNNRKGNDGLYFETESTDMGFKPSDNKGIYKISPLKAYIKGYEVDVISPVLLDFEKPRTIRTLNNQGVINYTGPTFTVNRVYGSPTLGLSTSFFLSLRDERVGASQSTAPGKEIGICRIYDYALESGSYNAAFPDLNQWDVSLYDIHPYVDITINEPLSLQVPTHIKGKASGATAFLRYSVTNSGIITAYNVRGKFSIGEKLIYDGIEDTRVTTSTKQYSVSDVKSIYALNDNGYPFTADVLQSPALNVGQVTITPSSGGISTVTSSNYSFTNNVFEGNIVAYSNPSYQDITYSKVVSVSTNTITISSVQTVTGLCNGILPASQITPSDFRVLKSSLQNSLDSTLYTTLPKRFVSNVDVLDGSLTVKKSFDVSITNNQTNTISAGSNGIFLPFDEERYVLTRDDGTIEPLSSDKFAFSDGNREVTIVGLGTNVTGTLLATLTKTKVKSKKKIKNKIKSIIIDKSKYSYSGIGTTTSNDGLQFGNFPYGSRVQDEEISLNWPDVTKIYGVYQSDDTAEPDIRKMVITNLSGNTAKTTDLLIGEEFLGSTSGAVAIYAERISDSRIGFIYLNTISFTEGERVTFKNSNVQGTIVTLTGSDNDITSDFTLDSGYRSTLYDYSRLVRKPNAKEPTRKLKIYFEHATYNTSDDGDITTVNSYSDYDYCDIPSTNGIRHSDIIDIRPRVNEYIVQENAFSSFEFFGRRIDADYNNSATNPIATSDESIVLNYSYYLPRIDRIFLDRTGQFHLVQGEASENPRIPLGKPESLEIATISLPAYLCDVSQANINLAEYKRYQMKDIRDLENRIKNLEFYTSLSLLESDTANLFIGDANGLNRFKSGFFVDDFSSAEPQLKVTDVKNSIDTKLGELRPAPFTTQIDLVLGTENTLGISTSPAQTSDLRFDQNLIGRGVKRTGQLVTLQYEEVAYITQGYASRVAPVTSFRNAYYAGSIQLVPSSDVWADQVKLTPRVIDVQGKYTKTQSQLTASQFNQQTGFGPVTWGAWETVWTGSTKIPAGSRTVVNGYDLIREDLAVTQKTGTSTKTGVAYKERESFESIKVGEVTVSSDLIPAMRSRNIEFTAKRLKPLTEVYAFFDKVDVNRYIIPKLLEIQMVSGVFQVGENVKTLNTSPIQSGNGITPLEDKFIRFRVAAAAHKYGPYNVPEDIFITNPYNISTLVPDTYSSSSTILNVDTFSLSNKTQGDYYGYVTVGMTLVGETSKAVATVSRIRMVTDRNGTLIGSFFIPNPNVPSNPTFETGTKLFRITSQEKNVTVIGVPVTGAEEKFYAEGTVKVVQESVLSVRNVQTETATIVDTRTDVSVGPPEVVASTVVGNIKPPPPQVVPIFIPAPYDGGEVDPDEIDEIINTIINDPEPAPQPAVYPTREPSEPTPRQGTATPVSPNDPKPDPPPSCPDPNCLILLADDTQKKAGELQIGDFVKTYHENTFEYGDYQVTYVEIVNNVTKFKLKFETSEIICSDSHKFYVDGLWKECKNMQIGDVVSEQKLLEIEQVDDGDVVKITVDDAHTYICEGLLSHNKTPVQETPKTFKVKNVTRSRGGVTAVTYVPFTTKNGKTREYNFRQIKKREGAAAAREAYKDAGVPIPPKNAPGRGKPAKPTGGDKKTSNVVTVQDKNGNLRIKDSSVPGGKVLKTLKPGTPKFDKFDVNDDGKISGKKENSLVITQTPKAAKRVTDRGEVKFEQRGFPVVQPRPQPRPEPRPSPRPSPPPAPRPSPRPQPAPAPRPAPRPAPAPAPRPSPRPAPAPAPRPSPAPSPRPSPAPSGGMGMSDINLKSNIQPIDNALNRLFSINLNNGVLS